MNLRHWARPALLSVSLALAATSFASAAKLPTAAVPISRMTTGWWRERFAAKQAELARTHPTLLWLGDSITQDWEHAGPQPWNNFAPVWQHFYGDRNAINLGFKGDATSHLLWRITHGETDNIHPKAAVMLIGANNFGLVHWSAADTLTGIDTIVAELHRRLPDMRILLISVLPSIRSAWVSQQTEEVNRLLAAHDWHGAPVTYVDVTSLFMRNGAVDRTAFLDPELTPPDPPLHPTAQTQERIAATIEPTLAGMLGDRNHAR